MLLFLYEVFNFLPKLFVLVIKILTNVTSIYYNKIKTSFYKLKKIKIEGFHFPCLCIFFICLQMYCSKFIRCFSLIKLNKINIYQIFQNIFKVNIKNL